MILEKLRPGQTIEREATNGQVDDSSIKSLRSKFGEMLPGSTLALERLPENRFSVAMRAVVKVPGIALVSPSVVPERGSAVIYPEQRLSRMVLSVVGPHQVGSRWMVTGRIESANYGFKPGSFVHFNEASSEHWFELSENPNALTVWVREQMAYLNNRALTNFWDSIR